MIQHDNVMKLYSGESCCLPPFALRCHTVVTGKLPPQVPVHRQARLDPSSLRTEALCVVRVLLSLSINLKATAHHSPAFRYVHPHTTDAHSVCEKLLRIYNDAQSYYTLPVHSSV